MSHKKNHDIRSISANFAIKGQLISYEPYGSGHINDTYCAIYEQGGNHIRYIFQRINHHVFKDPESLMENVERVTNHIRLKLKGRSDASRRVLTLVMTNDGKSYCKDPEGNFWRVYEFIENTKSCNIIETPEQAFQAAKAFGAFQRDLVDFKGKRLKDTIPDFHNTPKRFEALEEAFAADSCNHAKSADKEIQFALAHKDLTTHLLKLNAAGKIPERITHNDTKLNNVLIDEKTSEGICVIDLDTVMPGLALYDFGDLVRTSTSPTEEDEKDLSKVKMQMHMYEALVKGYLSAASEFLTREEKENLAFSGKLITFEIGLRFLTDHLSGDTYFKTHREGHNLDRCRTQFKLVECIESQEEAMNKIAKNI